MLRVDWSKAAPRRMSTLLAGVRGDQHPTCIGTRKRGHVIEKEVKARASNDEKPLMRRRLISATLLAYCLLSAPGLWAAEPPPEWNAIGDQTARLLAEYIRIDTQNPPGRTVEAVEFLQRLLREAGLEIEVIAADPEKPILRATLRGTGQRPKPIVLLNHMDVVPAEPSQWSVPPLSGEIRNGTVYGRGAIDMKGFGLVQLMALRLLAERGERPEPDIVFLAVPDEEIGGALGTAWLAENHPELMDAVGVWDEGGLALTGAFPKPLLFISVTEKQVLWLRLVVEGPAGHGSRPFPSAAPLRLQRALERVFANLPAPHLTPVSRQVFRQYGSVTAGLEGFALRHLGNPIVWLFADGLLQQDPTFNALNRNTISLTVLRAGSRPNVIPGRAEAVLDCRLLPDTTQDRFLTQLRQTIADPAVQIEIIQPTEPAAVSPTDNPLFVAIENAARQVYPEAIIGPTMTVSGTDSRFFRRHGVPAYGFSPILLSEELRATAHGVDERLPVE